MIIYVHERSCARSHNHIRHTDACRLLRIVSDRCFDVLQRSWWWCIRNLHDPWQRQIMTARILKKKTWWTCHGFLWPATFLRSHGFPHGFPVQANPHVYYPWDTGTGDVEAWIFDHSYRWEQDKLYASHSESSNLPSFSQKCSPKNDRTWPIKSM